MVVNCIQGHPIDSVVLASSGIGNDVKVRTFHSACLLNFTKLCSCGILVTHLSNQLK